MLLLALVAAVGIGSLGVFEQKQAAREAAMAGAAGAGGAGDRAYSSRVLNELARENKNFEALMRAIVDGTATNEEWLLLGSDETPTSPEFIAKSRRIADPTTASGRVARAAGPEGGAADGAAAASSNPAVRGKSGKTQRLASRMTSEELAQKTQADIAKKLEEIARMPWSPQAERLLNQALGQWAKIDPQAAMNYAMTLESRRARVNAVNNILSTWAQADPAAAQAWYLQNMPQDPLAAASTVRMLYSNMGIADMGAALAAVAQLPTAELQNIAMQTLMSQVVRSGDETAVLSYYSSLTDPAMKNYLAVSMAQTWAAYQPEVSAEWLAKVSDPAMLNKYVPSFAATWAYDDPAAAAQWASSIAYSSLRNSTVQSTTRTWAKEDPIAAADWVLTLNPPSPQADPAIQGLVGTISQAYPQGAMMWANSISDPNARVSSMKQVGKVWMAQDPANASIYIAQSDLPPNIKAQLLGQPVKPATPAATKKSTTKN